MVVSADISDVGEGEVAVDNEEEETELTGEEKEEETVGEEEEPPVAQVQLSSSGKMKTVSFLDPSR